jgi:hypothetical protein
VAGDRNLVSAMTATFGTLATLLAVIGLYGDHVQAAVIVALGPVQAADSRGPGPTSRAPRSKYLRKYAHGR